MSIFADQDPSINFEERSNVYMSYVPSGSGYKNFLHYAQLINY